MSAEEAGPSVPCLVDEYYGAPLGNTLRNRRLEQIVTAVCRQPSASFPSVFGSDAELEGFYRFVGGSRYCASDIMEPHVQRTSARVDAEKTAIVSHDTTEFEFSGEVEREGLGRLRSNDQGFLGHFSLAIAPQSRRPLGILAMSTWTRTGEPKRRKNDKKRSGGDYAKEPNKESARWLEAVQETEARVDASLIHVMDREADAYPLLAAMVADAFRFVTRLARDRAVGAEKVVGETDLMSDVLQCAALRAEREVPLSRRKSSPIPGSRHFPRREGRLARLNIRSMAVALQRPNYAGAELPKWLPINVVHVIETEPPEGEAPVEWILLTNEPIETKNDVLAVVDYYRARWVIEEYFKALKVGCAVEKRQLESYDTLSNALAVFVPIAWKLLELRTLARTTPAAPATAVITPEQVEILRVCGPLELPRRPTVRDALLAVAKLGGHIRNNGEPGWQVLGRGFEKLLALQQGWAAATKRRKR